GTTPLAARLPSTLAAAASLWLVGRLALRHGARQALTAPLLTACAPLFLVLSAFVIFDMLLPLCVTLVWPLIAREVRDGPTAAGRAGLFAALAAGLLVKGPVMLAWAVGGSLCAAGLLRSRAPLKWLGSRIGWMAVILVAGGWFAAVTW